MSTRPFRWLTVLLLVFDLASAPFHAHLHEIGGHDGAPAASASAAPAVAQDAAAGDDDAAYGHSMTALRTVHAQPAAAGSAGWHAAAIVPVRSEAAVSSRPRSDSRHRSPPAPFAHARPEGRAPPPLHA